MDVYLRHLINPDYYVLLIHPTSLLSKRYTLVALSSDPLQTVANLNPGHSGPVLYVLKAGCAFTSLAEASRVRHFLATKKRSFASKQKYLIKTARRHNLRYYSNDIEPPGGTRAYLERHAPGNFVSAYDRLITKGRM
jgi:hypothetical protein